MNLVLLFPDDFLDADIACLRDRRFQHVRDIHQPAPGDSLTVGLLNGDMGRGEVIALTADAVTLRITLGTPPPPPLPCTLLVALPRPKQLRRILRSVAEFGVKEVYLINTARVEKSYWQSPLLAEERLREYLLLGLEQARDTILPTVHLRRRFRPFVEDELPTLHPEARRLIAHPSENGAGLSAEPGRHQLLAIGPEGGFVPFEVDLLEQQAFQRVHLGERILRVENAVSASLARLFL